MSTDSRLALHASVVAQVRRFIAGSIFFNQNVADRHGLKLTDMQCINILEILGPVTPGKLAEGTGLSTGGVTVMLDRLEKAGLVIRERNPADRRSLLVRVVPEKIQQIQLYYAAINDQLEALLSETPESDLECVVNFLERANSIAPNNRPSDLERPNAS